LRFAIEPRQTPDNRNSEILNRNSFYRRVPPGERDLTSSDGDPGTNGVISKLAAKVRIKRVSGTLQASVCAHPLNQQFLLTPRLQAGGKSQREVKAVSTAFVAGPNPLKTADPSEPSVSPA
jgi:hypothetical protein